MLHVVTFGPVLVNGQLLAAPRLASQVAVVAPQIEGKLLYARTVDGRETAVMAGGEIPSRTFGAVSLSATAFA